MNKLFCVLLASALTTPAFAATSFTCTGKGWIHFAMVPFPLYRTITVAMTLTDSKQGSVTMDAGGDPLFYSGPVYLDGSQPSVVNNPDNGDITAMTFVMENLKTMIVAVQFSTSRHEKVGSVSPTNLTCK